MDISVIVPLFNEDESLPELAAWIERVMRENNFSYEIIMVDQKPGPHPGCKSFRRAGKLLRYPLSFILYR